MNNEGLINIITALIAAKAGFKSIKKDKKGNYGHYISLDAVLEAIEPALAENGLLICHQIADDVLITTLYHTSGEMIASNIKLPSEQSPQKIGSALTYYRRYSILCLLGICADEDDDGEATNNKKPEAAKAVSKPESKPTKPPLALVRDDTTKIAELRLCMVEHFEELGWSSDQKKAWAKKQDSRPSDQWPLAIWQSAINSLMNELDKKVM